MFYVCIAHCMRKSTKCQNVTILVSSCGALYVHVIQLDDGISQGSLGCVHFKPHKKHYIVTMGQCSPL